MATYRDSSGEIAITPRWGKCLICEAPTSQPPVCYDLTCELEYEAQFIHEPPEDHDYDGEANYIEGGDY